MKIKNKTAETHYRLYGSLGSPYSLKMRAALRYRRLPFVWIQEFLAATKLARQHGLPPLVPLMQFPDGSYHNDSSKLLSKLESRHPLARSLIPEHPGLAFLAYLLEDFADEWGTKLMFLHRWHAQAEQELLSRWLAFDNGIGSGEKALEQFSKMLKERQISRMPLVGCTPENQALLARHYAQLIDILNRHVRDHGAFLLGDRPSLAEFALFGQLSQLASDPQPRDQMIEAAPYCHRWLNHVDDLSGHEPANWLAQPDQVPAAVSELLNMIGKIYLPFLVANALALEQGRATLEVPMDGEIYRQAPFSYQGKCWLQLKDRFAQLDACNKSELRPLLERTNCWAHLQ